ncbi:MAG: hypothetical protein M3O70_11845, partial [Actinomycetota bacterium]|nr:hypothetical protein [Actinomycetota bacterium]
STIPFRPLAPARLDAILAVPGYRMDVKRRVIGWLGGLRQGYGDVAGSTERKYREIIEQAGVACA